MKKILVFLALTLALSAVFYYPIVRSGSLGVYTLGLMWCPGIAALLTQLLFERNLRGLGWQTAELKYWVWAYILPVIYGLVVYGLAWLTGLGSFIPFERVRQMAATLGIPESSPLLFLLVYIGLNATLGVVVNMAAALGEEIGWRGLLVPELYRQTSFFYCALISGLIWAAWHTPLILFADYHNPGGSTLFGLVCFTVMVVGQSFVYAWLRLKADSLWPAVVLHASHNLFIQAVFTPMTGNTGPTPYIIDEFGVGLALASLVLAYIFWRRRGELPGEGLGKPEPL